MIEHKNRVPGAGKANRKLITPEGGAAPYYATVTFADDPIDGGQAVNKLVLDELLAASGAAAGTADAITLAQAGFSLVDGATARIKLTNGMNKGASINIAGTGAHAIVDSLGKPAKAAAGSWITVIYNSTTTNFVLQGSGGGALRFGNAPGQVSIYELMDMGFNPFYTQGGSF